MSACNVWNQAGPIALVGGPGWENERSQVERWQQILTSAGPLRDVVEFSTGSFWTGYFTFRLLRAERFWVVAKFKKGKTNGKADYRVYELGAVRFTPLPMGEMKVTIGKKILRATSFLDPTFAAIPKSALSTSV
jgi:hypothetical protein